MNTKLDRFFSQRAMAILRLNDAVRARETVEICTAAGLITQEVTLTTPHALAIIKEMKGRFGDAITLGAGTVLTTEQCKAARDHGADFIVTPNLNVAVVRESLRVGLPIVPGCFTPSEMQLAHEEGAEAVKLFPASSVGPGFIKAVLAPLPHLKIIAFGGVNVENAGSYLEAGAAGVGFGTQLFGAASGSVAERQSQVKEALAKVAAPPA